MSLMEFCSTCGILLDLNLILDQSATFCNPCFETINQTKFPQSDACDCEICCFKDEDFMDQTLNSSNLHLYSELKQHNCSQNTKPLSQTQRKRKGRNKYKTQSASSKKKGSFVFKSSVKTCISIIPSDKNTDTQVDIDWDSSSPCYLVEERPSDVLNDWSAAAAESWSEEYLQDDWVNSDLSSPYVHLDDWGFTIPVSSSPPDTMGLTSSILTKPNSNLKEDKNNEEQPQHRNNSSGKNHHLFEKVGVKWKREQNEYCAKLLAEDTPEIAALVAGQRRKDDGSRYFVGGVDISFIKGNNEDACACLSVLRMPDLKLVYQRMEMVKLTQPYIPGFLAFREVPALEPLFGHLKAVAPQYWPDITLVDGNGKLHPRGFGLACHLGVVLDIPTMGVAKSLISAQGISEDEEHKRLKRTLAGAGDGFDLISDSDEVLGKCLRVHDGAPNPVYISVGHKVSLQSAVWLALECSMFRIPEPVRRADLDSREYLRQGKTEPEQFVLSHDEGN